MSDFLGMQRAVLRSARPTTEKIALLAIIDHWSEASPDPWPSVPTLATLSSLGRTAVLDALAALERDGVIGVERVRLADGTSPSGGRDQSARRTRRIPRSNQRRKPLPCARTRQVHPQLRSPCRSPNVPSSCSKARGKPSGCNRSNGQRPGKSRKPTVELLAARARCRKSRVIRACAPFWSCLQRGRRRSEKVAGSVLVVPSGLLRICQGEQPAFIRVGLRSHAHENRAAEHVYKCGHVLGVLSGVGRVLCLEVERERLRHIPRRRPRQV